jgi:hypothetical protein
MAYPTPPVQMIAIVTIETSARWEGHPDSIDGH